MPAVETEIFLDCDSSLVVSKPFLVAPVINRSEISKSVTIEDDSLILPQIKKVETPHKSTPPLLGSIQMSKQNGNT